MGYFVDLLLAYRKVLTYMYSSEYCGVRYLPMSLLPRYIGSGMQRLGS